MSAFDITVKIPLVFMYKFNACQQRWALSSSRSCGRQSEHETLTADEKKLQKSGSTLAGPAGTAPTPMISMASLVHRFPNHICV